MDFNPDLSDSNGKDKKQEEIKELDVPTSTPVVSVVGNSNEVISIKNLVDMTVSHMAEDLKCRESIDRINDTLEELTGIMGTKELIEYLKVKINERRFHVECVYKAFDFVQKTELAKEMLLGAERKERIIKAANSNTYNKLMGMLNMHSDDDTGNE